MESKEKYEVKDDIKQVTALKGTDVEYLKRLKELLDLKRRGDWILVAELLKISPKNAEISFARVASKYHTRVVEALSMIIENRRKMLKGV